MEEEGIISIGVEGGVQGLGGVGDSFSSLLKCSICMGERLRIPA